MYVCMYVCMSVRNGFTIEIYGFMHRLLTFWHVQLRMPLRNVEIAVGGRRLTAQQKDERRRDNGDKKRLAHHHPSNLLRSLIREQIRGGQHGIVSPALRPSPFRTFHVIHVRHQMCMRIPSFEIISEAKLPLSITAKDVEGMGDGLVQLKKQQSNHKVFSTIMRSTKM